MKNFGVGDADGFREEVKKYVKRDNCGCTVLNIVCNDIRIVLYFRRCGLFGWLQQDTCQRKEKRTTAFECRGKGQKRARRTGNAS